MANNNLTRPGQINLAGDTDAMFLKVFSGEVLAAFQENNVFMPLHFVRSITSGKSAQFPAIGRATSGYHVPGTEIVGSPIAGAERVIVIDGILLASTTVAQIDELKNHYDVRGQYSTELGQKLAKDLDTVVAQVIVNAARAPATVTGLPGGSTLNKATYTTSADDLAQGLFDAAATLDTKDIPENDRYAAIRPVQYYMLVAGTKVINRDWGGAGVYADGKVLKVAGIHIVKSNHIPSTNVTGSAQAAYDGNFTTTVGMVFHKSAAGTVKLLDVTSEAEWDIRRQSWLMLAKTAVGHGILRPESAVELRTADPA